MKETLEPDGGSGGGTLGYAAAYDTSIIALPLCVQSCVFLYDASLLFIDLYFDSMNSTYLDLSDPIGAPKYISYGSSFGFGSLSSLSIVFRVLLLLLLTPLVLLPSWPCCMPFR